MNASALDRAVQYFAGGRAQLAAELDLTPMAISQWYKRGIPPARAIDVERATKKAVTRFELLPDFFGPASNSKAA